MEKKKARGCILKMFNFVERIKTLLSTRDMHLYPELKA